MEVERQKVKDDKEASSFHILICQNYFGVIIVLSIFWIAKQFSILRAIVILLLINGIVKR